MPVGEEMFKFHGFSGPCPKPPLSRLHQKCVVEYVLRSDREGRFWIEITSDRDQALQLGPFDTEIEAKRAYDDLLDMMQSFGAVDVAVT